MYNINQHPIRWAGDDDRQGPGPPLVIWALLVLLVVLVTA